MRSASTERCWISRRMFLAHVVIPKLMFSTSLLAVHQETSDYIVLRYFSLNSYHQRYCDLSGIVSARWFASLAANDSLVCWYQRWCCDKGRVAPVRCCCILGSNSLSCTLVSEDLWRFKRCGSIEMYFILSSSLISPSDTTEGPATIWGAAIQWDNDNGQSRRIHSRATTICFILMWDMVVPSRCS